MNNKSFDELITGYVNGQLSEDELACFLQLLQKEEHRNDLQDNIDQLLVTRNFSDKADFRRADFLFDKIMENAEAEESLTGKVIRLKKKPTLFTFAKIAAAACVSGLLIFNTYVRFNKNGKKEITKTEVTAGHRKNEIVPGGNKAILTLADGSTVILDDAKNGVLAQQGDTKVIKLNGGKLNYDASAGANEVLYNTISTPRGGKYQIELPDGSQVWLNAESSLRFPTAFIGKERKVEISGEAYFEITKNKAMPFTVRAQDADVVVLGTHFNIMAYTNETSLKTTLLEGSVKFIKNRIVNILKPGQQSQLLKSGGVKVVGGVDVDEVVAWKNGTFNFNGTDIGTVIRQLSRWYDVEAVYKGDVDELFYAEIPRSTKLSDVLKALELTGKVRFEIDGRRIIVKS